MALTQRSKRKRIFLQRKDSLRDLWDNIKQNNICILGIPEKEKKMGWKTDLKK